MPAQKPTATVRLPLNAFFWYLRFLYAQERLFLNKDKTAVRRYQNAFIWTNTTQNAFIIELYESVPVFNKETPGCLNNLNTSKEHHWTIVYPAHWLREAGGNVSEFGAS